MDHTPRITLAAALAVMSLKVFDAFGLHLNGNSPEAVAAMTVIIEWTLRAIGISVSPPVDSA